MRLGVDVDFVGGFVLGEAVGEHLVEVDHLVRALDSGR